MKYVIPSLAFASLCLLTGCSQSEPAKTETTTTETTNSITASTSDTTPTSGKIYTVAVDSNFPPFSYLDENGKPIGYDVDLINAIANKANMNVEVTTKSWLDFPQALNDDQVDLWIAGISISEERKAIIDYSDPYLTYKTGVLTKNDEKGMAINQANLAEQRLIALEGTVDFDYAQTVAKKPQNLQGVPTSFLAMKAIVTDNADAFINNNRVLQYHVKQYPEYNLRIFNIDLANAGGKDGNLGIAVKKGNMDLIKKLNQGLADIKQDGTYNKINQQWFGTNEQ